MLPQTQKRVARNSAKVNLILAAAFHAAIVVVLLYFAAREGLLGKQIKKIAVEMVKEKPPEKPKEPDKPKPEPPKLDTPKLIQAPKIEEAKAAPPPATGPVVEVPPVAAAAAVDTASFNFEGGKAVETTSDPVEIYKNLVEYALRTHWDRPIDMVDHSFVAEVEVSVDSSGQISSPVWKKASGNTQWDNTVRGALAATKSMDRPPPPHFPARVVVRFDVVQMETVGQ